MKLEGLAPAELERMVEDLGDLHHDLGRYVSFEVRFLGDAPETEALRSALRADLERTRRQGEAVQDCGAVWRRARPAGLDGEPEIAELDLLIEALSRADLAGDRPTLDRAAEQARRVGVLTRALLDRARACLGGG